VSPGDERPLPACPSFPSFWRTVVPLLVLAAGCSSSEQPGPLNVRDEDAGGGRANGTGGASAATGGAPVAPGGGGASACVPALARCDASGDRCCSGTVCAPGTDGVRRCVQVCEDRLECGSLCCALDEATGLRVCADESACPPLECSGERGPCTQPGPSCCEGLTCVFSRAPEYSGCRKPCEKSEECDTGCCVPYANATASFCADATACACAKGNEQCGGVRRCCDGLACTSFDATGAFACKPKCKQNEDCDTGCCVPIAQTAESACLPKEWCAP
jgi:hypothetical protein